MRKVKTGTITKGDEPYALLFTVRAGQEMADKYKLDRDLNHAPAWQVLALEDGTIEIHFEAESDICKFPVRKKAEGETYEDAKKDIERTTGKNLSVLVESRASEEVA